MKSNRWQFWLLKKSGTGLELHPLTLFRADNTTALAQQIADSRIEFQSPYWDPVSDQAKSFIRHLAAVDPLHRPTAQEALRDPWLTSLTTAFHVDLSPTLRQNPRVAQCFDWYQGCKQV